MPQRVGFHAGVAIANDDICHRIPFGVLESSTDGVILCFFDDGGFLRGNDLLLDFLLCGKFGEGIGHHLRGRMLGDSLVLLAYCHADTYTCQETGDGDNP